MAAVIAMSDDKLIDLRLEAWARWARDGLSPWPKRTVLGRVIDEGWAAGETGGGHDMPDEIAKIDAAVAKLVAIDRKVIVTFYTQWEPVNVMARRCKMREQQFRNVLKRAKWRLGLYLQ